VEPGHDVAEGVVGNLVEDGTPFVQHQPHRVQVVGQIPLHPLTGVRGSQIHPREEAASPTHGGGAASQPGGRGQGLRGGGGIAAKSWRYRQDCY